MGEYRQLEGTEKLYNVVMIITSSRYDVMLTLTAYVQMFSEILAVLVKEAEIHSLNHPLRFYIQ